MRVIVTGGGTGGHIYPALAIAKGIEGKYPGAEIIYVGTGGGLEADIVPQTGYPFKKINIAAGFARKLTLKNFKVLWQAGGGLVEARKIIKQFKPDIVIGTGGYVSGSVVMAAVLSRTPTLIHEQNALPGITNKILARFVTTVAVTFEDSIARFPSKTRIHLTGLPVRPETFSVDKEQAYARLNLQADKPVVLVFGGSRGARKINNALLTVLKQPIDAVQIMLVTGKKEYQSYLQTLGDAGIVLDNSGNIDIIPYLYNMPDALAVADLVICRAGAATLAELTALGLPSILIPYPYAAENHQEYNARALAERGAAIMIKDQQLTGDLLVNKINDLLSNPHKLAEMATSSGSMGRPQALPEILTLIDAITNK